MRRVRNREIVIPVVVGTVAHLIPDAEKEQEPENPNTHRWTVYLRAPDNSDLTWVIQKVISYHIIHHMIVCDIYLSSLSFIPLVPFVTLAARPSPRLSLAPLPCSSSPWLLSLALSHRPHQPTYRPRREVTRGH